MIWKTPPAPDMHTGAFRVRSEFWEIQEAPVGQGRELGIRHKAKNPGQEGPCLPLGTKSEHFKLGFRVIIQFLYVDLMFAMSFAVSYVSYIICSQLCFLVYFCVKINPCGQRT